MPKTIDGKALLRSMKREAAIQLHQEHLFRIRRILVVGLGVLGMAALLAVGYAFTVPEWRPHSLHLLYRSWVAFTANEGASTTGMVSNLVYPFVFVIITLILIWRQRGWVSVMAHWREEALTVLGVSTIAIFVVYGSLFVWNVVRTIYMDHQHLSSTVRAFMTTNVQYAKQIDELKIERDALKAEKNRLSNLVPPEQLAKTRALLSNLLSRSSVVLDSCRGGPNAECEVKRRRWERTAEVILKAYTFDPSGAARWTSYIHQNQAGPPFNEVGNEANMLSAIIADLK